MAKGDTLDHEAKIRLLRDLAHQVRRKQPLDDLLREHIDMQLQAGRRRLYRPAAEALNGEGPVGTLRVLDLVGEEAALLLAAVVEAKDHRLLANALGALADFQERQASAG